MCMVKGTARELSIDHMTGYKFVERGYEERGYEAATEAGVAPGYRGYYTGAPMPLGGTIVAVGRGFYHPSAAVPDYTLGFHFYGSEKDARAAFELLGMSTRSGVLVKISAWGVRYVGKDGTSYDDEVNKIDVYVADKIQIMGEMAVGDGR